MGSEAFDRDQYRLAWVVIGVIGAWFSWGLFYLDYRFIVQDGSTLRLMREQTDYHSQLSYWFGEGGAVFYGLLVTAIVGMAYWLYRGYRDGWAFLYCSTGDTTQRRSSYRPEPPKVDETLLFVGVLGPIVAIVAIDGLARLGGWPLHPVASAAFVLVGGLALSALVWWDVHR